MEKLSETARAAKNAYQKEWRRKNPGKTREHVYRYWEKKAAEMEAARKEDKYNG